MCAGVCVGAPQLLQVSSGCLCTTVPVMIVLVLIFDAQVAPVGQTCVQALQPMHSSAGRMKSR